MRLAFDLRALGPERIVLRTYTVFRNDMTPDVVRGIMSGALEASRMGHEYLGSEHLLLGYLQEPSGIKLFGDVGTFPGKSVNVESVRKEVLKLVKQEPEINPTYLDLTPVSIKALDHTLEVARNMKLDKIDMRASVLGVLKQRMDSPGVLALRNLGVNEERLYERIFSSLCPASPIVI